jgi:hypothetical protein
MREAIGIPHLILSLSRLDRWPEFQRVRDTESWNALSRSHVVFPAFLRDHRGRNFQRIRYAGCTVLLTCQRNHSGPEFQCVSNTGVDLDLLRAGVLFSHMFID